MQMAQYAFMFGCLGTWLQPGHVTGQWQETGGGMGQQSSDSIIHTREKTTGVRAGCISLNTLLYNNQLHTGKPMCF